MSQNRSTAVMQRRAEVPDSLDDFPTPPWATRALCEALIDEGFDLGASHVWEPACNRGHMAAPLAEHFGSVFATDVHDYGWSGQQGTADFLIDWSQSAPKVDWVITNPPFRLAAEFVRQGLRFGNVAVFVRNAFDEGVARYETLFRDLPEALSLPFVERVIIWKGVLLDPDVPIWRDWKLQKPSSATAYKWMIWLRDERAFGPKTELRRIPPCRRRLTRPGDYPPLPLHLRPPDGRLI